ncbi:MAG TPA: hypothetical protein VMQ17_02395 [Candidatus Sulfotelmatobacter sp.]|nr:hypothetical protein [Candidatus Sulfotelmatobacter sp.]
MRNLWTLANLKGKSKQHIDGKDGRKLKLQMQVYIDGMIGTKEDRTHFNWD